MTNPETGCISNEELERRERKYGRPVMSEESIQKLRDIDEKSMSMKLAFTPFVETLRDRFAMAALTGLLGSFDSAPKELPQQVTDSMASFSYLVADSMLEERKN